MKQTFFFAENAQFWVTRDIGMGRMFSSFWAKWCNRFCRSMFSYWDVLKSLTAVVNFLFISRFVSRCMGQVALMSSGSEEMRWISSVSEWSHWTSIDSRTSECDLLYLKKLRWEREGDVASEQYRESTPVSGLHFIHCLKWTLAKQSIMCHHDWPWTHTRTVFPRKKETRASISYQEYTGLVFE